MPRIRRLFETVGRYDRSIFRAVTLLPTGRADRFFRRVSWAANGSTLWSAVSALLTLLGGRRGRRAARQGMTALGIAAFIANVPVKMIARRRRPVLIDVPVVRQLRRAPRSSSFPSGHSASAFAFATAASLEFPWIAAPVGVLAAAVAYSRIHTGVHYPSDVAVGSAIGVGTGIVVYGLSSRRPDEAARVTASPTAPSGDGEGHVIVVNPDAGSSGPDLAETLRHALPAAQIVEAADVDDALRDATSGARVLGVAGGDGTVSAAADVALARGLPLLVIPAGTLNHFARALGIATVDDAIDAARAGHTATVDVASLAGKTFVNTASFGIYSDLVDVRERLEERLGKRVSLVIALGRVLRRSSPVKVEIDGDAVSIWLAFAGNCRYAKSGLLPTKRDRLDDGILDVRYVLAGRRFGRLRLVGAALAGRLDRSSVYRAHEARKVRVRSLDGPLRLVHDGETFSGPASFEITKQAERLTVIVPERKA